MEEISFSTSPRNKNRLLYVGIILAIIIGWLTSILGFAIPAILLGVTFLISFLLIVFNKPRLGLIVFICYCFLMWFLYREVGDLPFSYAVEGLLALIWLAVIFHNSANFDWSFMKNEITFIGLAWCLLTVLEFFNPTTLGNVNSWIGDSRYPFLWIFIVPLSMTIFNKYKDLNLFLYIILFFSLIAAFNGIRQIQVGLTQAEKAFLVSSPTHVIFGKLRVFSYYSDAGQFGASMAQMCVIALILVLGPFKLWKRGVCAVAAVIFLYAMSISGTRGAMFCLFGGILVVLVASKNIKIVMVAGILGLLGFGFLKFTFIGHNISEVRRMRSALNPNDASLNLRFYNQQRLAAYLKHYPFGGGIGSIGYASRGAAKKAPFANIEPDSYWVKIWANYGIVGLTIWFSMMMYIVGKCSGIIWNIKNQRLKIKLTALTAGATGIFLCSYGNEVMNNVPSSIVLYISWAFIFLGPKLDREAQIAENNG
ncbi:MAG: hypothetical protein COW65_15730 [Cytophagales bacterium CG18_big_fil_WC_8_21_14_2_50_42_9]|nr:MAG: hypothetical protein COW65_15730 [Cytophagales bacterium CG18_big_fil_WC_8_21_14_2_50_42_9]